MIIYSISSIKFHLNLYEYFQLFLDAKGFWVIVSTHSGVTIGSLFQSVVCVDGLAWEEGGRRCLWGNLWKCPLVKLWYLLRTPFGGEKVAARIFESVTGLYVDNEVGLETDIGLPACSFQDMKSTEWCWFDGWDLCSNFFFPRPCMTVYAGACVAKKYIVLL